MQPCVLIQTEMGQGQLLLEMTVTPDSFEMVKRIKKYSLKAYHNCNLNNR